MSNRQVIMTLAIVTDTASDILVDLRVREDVYIVSTQVIVDKKEYLDNDITTDELIVMFENGQYSKTSQPSPEEFHSTYVSALSTHDQVLGIHIGSKLSGLFSGAQFTQKNLEGDIILFDTHNVSFGSGFYVSCAISLKDLGYSRDQIVRVLYKLRDKVHLRVLIDDVDYLKRGGRVSLKQYWLLKLFKLKPIVANHEGKIVSVGLSFGRKSGIRKIVRLITQHYSEGYTVYIGQINTPKDLRLLYAITSKHLDLPTEVKISATLLSHTGPRALGILVGPDIIEFIRNID